MRGNQFADQIAGQSTAARSNCVGKWYCLMFILAIILLTVLGCVFATKHFLLHLRVAFAEDQVDFFERRGEEAINSEPSAAASKLESVLNYYPSGTKQDQGSRLDHIVEVARNNTIREIIAYLRIKMRIDLGDNPQVWIDHFRHHKGIDNMIDKK